MEQKYVVTFSCLYNMLFRHSFTIFKTIIKKVYHFVGTGRHHYLKIVIKHFLTLYIMIKRQQLLFMTKLMTEIKTIYFRNYF